MTCSHMTGLAPVPSRTPQGCEECLKTGSAWVHLRLCLGCGHVGCCDSSPGRHATKHFHLTGDPVIASFEPGEHGRGATSIKCNSMCRSAFCRYFAS